MRSKHTKRILSLFLSVAMLTQVGVPVFAQATEYGIMQCEHHAEHTNNCGYVKGQFCSHVHNVEECSYVEAKVKQYCNFNADELAETQNNAAQHTHVSECGYAEEIKGVDCNHKHDEACQFADAMPCKFVCKKCKEENSNAPMPDVGSIIITKFEDIDNAVQQRTVDAGTKLEQLDLPNTLLATGYTAADDKASEGSTSSAVTSEAIIIEAVTWRLDPENNIDNDNYKPESGSYCFIPVLPKGYALAKGVALPKIDVRVGMMLGKVKTLASTGDGFIITGGNLNEDYTYNNNVLTILGSTSLAISGSTTEYSIVVKENTIANITLNDVDIQFNNGGFGSWGTCAFELESKANVTLTLEGENTLKSGCDKAGLRVPDDASLTIKGDGVLNASGGNSSGYGGGGGAGIGGEARSGKNSGTVNIIDGIVNAIGGSSYGDGGTGVGGGAGIGGGGSDKSGGTGGNVTISGGIVNAIGGGIGDSIGAGIGGGGGGIGTGIGGSGTFSTNSSENSKGNAFLMASSIADNSNSNSWSGIIFGGEQDHNIGKIYGDTYILAYDATMPSDKTLTIANTQTLTIKEDVTLTIDKAATLSNNGIIRNYGTINGTVTDNGSIYNPSQVEVSFTDDAIYGYTLKVTAAVKAKAISNPSLGISGTVDFYLASVDTEHKLNADAININEGKATLDIELIGDMWSIGKKTIIAVYNGSGDGDNALTYKLLESQGQSILTVNKAEPNAPSAPTQASSDTDTSHNSITISTVADQKYICTTDSSTPEISNTGWKTSNGDTYTFAELVRNTPYYIWTYKMENDNYKDSPVSSSLLVNTKKEPIVNADVLGITAPVANAKPDSEADKNTYWTANAVAWFNSNNPHASAFEYDTAYTAKVTLTAADGYEFADDPTANVDGADKAIAKKEDDTTLTVSAIYPKTSVQGQTAAPSFANSTYAMPTPTATTATFALTNEANIYALYDVATDGIAIQDKPNMSVSGNTLTLTLDAAPTEDKTYYVSATTDYDKESTRTKITVKTYIPTSRITLNKNTLELKIRTTETLIATIAPENANNKAVTWRSSNADVATVSNGVVTAVGVGTATITASTADGKTATCALKVTRPSTDDNDDDDDHGGGTKPPAPPTTKPAVTVDNDGNAQTEISDSTVQEAIKKAEEEAKKNGIGANGITVSLALDVKDTANSLIVKLPPAPLNRLIASKNASLSLTSDFINLQFDSETLKQMQSTSDITIKILRQDVKKLSEAAQTTIGSRPAIDITVTGLKNSAVANITDFGKGIISVGLPYSKASSEQASHLSAVYVDNKGVVSYLPDSSYDVVGKMLMFSTNHLSVYGVAYKAPAPALTPALTAPAFTDIANHWAKADIEFVAEKGLLAGTSARDFSPNIAMTRGMFVTALGRLAVIDANSYNTSKFTDVQANAYYAPYVNWAAEKSIVNGTSTGTFSANTAITRQEMAVIMQNYAKAMGYTVSKASEAISFADKENIASWASEAVKAMQMADIIMGRDDNKFDPNGTATRAEVSAVLHRYVELVVDKAIS